MASLPAQESDPRTVPRYRDILRTSSREHRNCKDTIQRLLQRQELFGNANGSSNSLRPRTELLLREKNGLHTSIEMTDSLIGSARRARDQLGDTREVFGGVTQRVGKINHTLPGVGDVIGKIGRSKQRDMIVISILIASLMFFTLLYIINK